MDKLDSKPQRKHHHRDNPSFSSTLLDVIYRSIDEGQTQTPPQQQQQEVIFYRETMRKQKQNNIITNFEAEAEKVNSRRSKKVDNWMEKRNSLTEFERRTRRCNSNSNSNSNSNTLSMFSSSTSSDSSSVGGFSSSESESFFGVQRPKPIRTSVSEKSNFDALQSFKVQTQTQKPKREENGFGKTKSKALRILYGDLKKAKQPISPGARLASFLNSLFTSSGNAKKPKVSSSNSSFVAPTQQHHHHHHHQQLQQLQQPQPSSTCSSASSFSRSCLSKTPSSRSGAKRSVRFCPVSVIVDEDCRPCGHKNLHEGEKKFVSSSSSVSYGKIKNSGEELRFHVMQESRRVEELARDLLKNYHKKNDLDFDHVMHYEDEEEDDDDDGASCSSSDLFELDNLSAIGIQRYREELPVYETTHFNTNRAIANGFIM